MTCSQWDSLEVTTLGSEHRIQTWPRIRLTSLWQGSAKDPREECSRSAQPGGMEPGPALGPFWNNNSRQSRQVNILETIPHSIPLLEITIHICKLKLRKVPRWEKKKKGKKVLETGLPEGHVRAQPSGHSIFQRTFIKHLLSFRCVPGTRATAERKTSKVQTLKELTF